MNIDTIRNEIKQLTLVKHTETKEEALQIQQEYKELAKNGGVYADFVYIYDKDTLFHFDNKLKLEGDSLC